MPLIAKQRIVRGSPVVFAADHLARIGIEMFHEEPPDQIPIIADAAGLHGRCVQQHAWIFEAAERQNEAACMNGRRFAFECAQMKAMHLMPCGIHLDVDEIGVEQNVERGCALEPAAIFDAKGGRRTAVVPHFVADTAIIEGKVTRSLG